MAKYKKSQAKQQRNQQRPAGSESVITSVVAAKKNAPTSSRQQTIQQQRAGFALNKVLSVKNDADADTAKRFRAYANSWPAMIQTNGIGQALAFAKMKGNGKNPEAQAWLTLYRTMSEWLTTGAGKIWPGQADAIQGLVQGDQQQYQRAQAEAQALLVWVKQFARAEIAGETNE